MRPSPRFFLACALVLAVLVPTPAMAQTLAGEPLGDVKVIAHRGASGYAPEHTFFAYDLAIEQDSDFIECDMQMTSDGVLVCVHDSTVDRTSDGTGDIEQLSLADLRALDWGSWFNDTATEPNERFAGAQVVPFEEQLDCYRAINPRVRFHIETKSPESLGGAMEAELARVLGDRGLIPEDGPNPATDLAIVQSFSRLSLEIMKSEEPRLATALLFAAPDGTNVTLEEAALGTVPDVADAMAPNSAFLAANPTYIDNVHANGAEVHTWTVDDEAQMQRLVDAGVDGIFTNVPDVARQVVDGGGNAVSAELRGNPADVDPLCPGVAGTVERDTIAESMRFSGLTFSAGGPAGIAGRGEFAYAPHVLIARDDTFADALGSGGLQAALDAPLLLTGADALDGRVRAELVRLGAERVTILGGPDAVSVEVEDTLTALDLEVSRLDGATRLETAVAVAEASMQQAPSTTAVIARADGPGTAAFADALPAGALASALGAPVLLTDTETLSPVTAAFLESQPITEVVVAGGVEAVSEATADAIRGLGVEVVRASGATRYDTAVALADLLPGGLDRIVLVDGTAADGWAAGFTAASAATDGGTVVLPVQGETVPTVVQDVITTSGADVVCALGVSQRAGCG